jgi:hypothetical protein
LISRGSRRYGSLLLSLSLPLQLQLQLPLLRPRTR